MTVESPEKEEKNATQNSVSGRDLSFYQIDASSIEENARKLLVNYSGLAPEEVNKHVDAIREKAFKIYSYPCIGMYRFLDLSIVQRKEYPEVVQRLKDGEKILDLGCCFGQEIRQLVSDGVPSENCYGSDLRPEFIELGYELFKDREKLKATFLPADIFDDESPLTQIYSQMSIVYTGSFFHLFDRNEQIDVAKRVVQLLKPEPGSMVIGRQVGNINPREYSRSGYAGEKGRFRHDPKSWQDLWDKVGETTGTKWEVEAELDPFGVGFGEMTEKKLTERRGEEGARRLKFVVRRV